MYSLWNWILDSFFPETCIGCKNPSSRICESCLSLLTQNPRETHPDIYAGFDYRNTLIKQAIWHLKYHKQSSLGILLGSLLYEAYIEEIATLHEFHKGSMITLVPVPLFKHKQRIRGYNQAEKIAQGFRDACIKSGIPCQIDTHLIIKTKDTTPQARISDRKKRLKNVRGVFSCTQTHGCANKIIIVIDDVTTTGGTLTEIMNLCLKNGALHAQGFAVAH
ncbi:MAG: ComF family protein [Candidatus Pacebacteria bacterium]|jgi:amidophosphoribosyltransferase|nr:ComF family protein [Candidatus Paceibacterota bacterium]